MKGATDGATDYSPEVERREQSQSQEPKSRSVKDAKGQKSEIRANNGLKTQVQKTGPKTSSQ